MTAIRSSYRLMYCDGNVSGTRQTFLARHHFECTVDGHRYDREVKFGGEHICAASECMYFAIGAA